MSRSGGLLQSIVNVRRLGNGSFWRGVAYLVASLMIVLTFLAMLPVLLALVLPDWMVLLVSLLLSLAILGGVIYLGAAGYKKIRSLIRSG